MLLRGWIVRKTPDREVSVWATKVIRLLLTFYHKCWTRRNDIKFGSSPEARKKIQKNRLIDKVNEVYDTRHLFFDTNDSMIQILFKKDRAEWNRVSINNIQAWLETVRQAAIRRGNGDFNFDIMEYLRFERATTFSD